MDNLGHRTVEFVCNQGIGDVSWCLSKVLAIPKITQGEVEISIAACNGYPQRAHQLVELVPGVKWAGYRNITDQEVYFQHVPPKWPWHWGLDPLTKLAQVNLTPCTHFEAKGTLEEWLTGSGLPTDYHYKIELLELRLTSAGIGVYDPNAAAGLRPYYAVSVSSRHLNGTAEWHIWDAAEWFGFLYRIAIKTDVKNFVLIGAEYDRDSAVEVGNMLKAHGLTTSYVIGQPLGYSLRIIEQASCYFAYQSGLAVLANVLNTPCLTLLPAHLPDLHKSYADPADLASGKYWGMAVPTVEQAAEWFEETGIHHVRR